MATDLDGTLLRDDGTVSARTTRALANLEERGIDVVFVTARPPRWLVDVEHMIGGHGTVICLNGALVHEVATGATLAEHPMPDGLVRALARDLRASVPGIAFALEHARGFAVERGFGSVHPVPAGTPRADRIEELLDGVTGKLLARSAVLAEDRVIAEVDRVLAGRAIVADSGARGLAEMTGPGVTKAATLARWTTERGISPEEVWAFGDMPNDLAMLAWAGRAFAVANAHPSVRAAADEVCPSNQEDGVARVIERVLGHGR